METHGVMSNFIKTKMIAYDKINLVNNKVSFKIL